MKTVQDISVEARALQQQGFTPRQVADRILKIGQANGFRKIDEYSRGHPSPTTTELVFHTSETIYFDGADWHYFHCGKKANGDGGLAGGWSKR
jgi:hypothetical protein